MQNEIDDLNDLVYLGEENTKNIEVTSILSDLQTGYSSNFTKVSWDGLNLVGNLGTNSFVSFGKASTDYKLIAGRKYRIVCDNLNKVNYRTMVNYSFKEVIYLALNNIEQNYVDFTPKYDGNLCLQTQGGAGDFNINIAVYDITDLTDEELVYLKEPKKNITIKTHKNKSENVTYKSKNKLDLEKVETGLLNSAGNVNANSLSYRTTDFIIASDFVSYCGEAKAKLAFNVIAFYDEDKKHLSTIIDWEKEKDAYLLKDMPEKTVFFRISYYKDYIENRTYQMIEEGSEKTGWQDYFEEYTSNYEQPYFNKKFDTLGDSITSQRKWQNYIADEFHTGIIYNNGIGGTCVGGTGENAFYQNVRVNALHEDADVLLIMGGTNDGAQKNTIGEFSKDNMDVNTFVGAYNTLLTKIYYKYYHIGFVSGVDQTSDVREIKIVLATPIYCSDTNYGTMSEIADAVRKIAKMWNLPLADQYSESGINETTSQLYLTDKIHPNVEGGKKISDVFIKILKENFVTVK